MRSIPCNRVTITKRMMARTKPIRRSYGAGEWGRNRVRVFPDPKTGLFQINGPGGTLMEHLGPSRTILHRPEVS